MENSKEQVEKLTPREEEMKNQLMQAFSNLKSMKTQNQELYKKYIAYQLTDFYQRVNWLWIFVKEGENIFDKDFISYCINELVEMFNPKETKEVKEEEETKE